MGSPVMIEGKSGVVIVQNRSELTRAMSVDVSLISYKRLGDMRALEINARVYSDSMQTLVVDINPGREETFNLFWIKYDFDKIMLGPFANKRRHNIAPGKYKLKIAASSETVMPVEEDCFLAFDGYGAIEFRQWQAGDEA